MPLGRSSRSSCFPFLLHALSESFRSRRGVRAIVTVAFHDFESGDLCPPIIMIRHHLARQGVTDE